MPNALEMLQRTVNTLNMLPNPMRQRALSTVLGRIVPYVGTSGIVIEEMTPQRVITVARNKRPYRNHIGQVHAAAMALAVETASGFVVGLGLPLTSLPLIKTLKIDYRKRSKGDIRAVATLTEEQLETIRREPKGSIDVEVHATDASGGEPIECLATWAWVPRKR